MKMSVRTVVFIAFSATVALVTLIGCGTTLIDLFGFLSSTTYVKTQFVPIRDNAWTSLAWYLLIDQVLLSLFILQHSILSIPTIKNWQGFEDFKTIKRCLYIICSCIPLHVMMKYWHSTPDVVLWNVDFNMINNKWLFGIIHGFAWVLIYLGSVVMDPAELLGVKQVYYNARNFGNPCEYKSHDLNRLLSRVRHPSFIGFCVIFWIVPTMSLDRLLLATILTYYMALAWNVDDEDYHYQTLQHHKKLRELSRVN